MEEDIFDDLNASLDAFVQSVAPIAREQLDQHCLVSGSIGLSTAKCELSFVMCGVRLVIALEEDGKPRGELSEDDRNELIKAMSTVVIKAVIKALGYTDRLSVRGTKVEKMSDGVYALAWSMIRPLPAPESATIH